MIGPLLTDRKGNVIVPPSLYKPTPEVANFTSKVKKDYEIGHQIQNRTFREFNDLSVLQVMDRDQKLFNTYVNPPSQDPDEAWKYDGKRPLARNKLITLAAHVTAQLVVPNVFAQNNSDEEDKEAAQVMRDLIEWNIQNSDYEMSFLFGIISGLVNPAIYMKSEFVEAMQSVKERSENGKTTRKEVVDEVLSGLKTAIVPVDEVLIANAYEYEIQKQRFIGRRRFIDFDEAQALYGKEENFKFIRPGIKAIYSEGNSMFYEQKDEELQSLVEEFTYYNRREDCECVFINGIYFGETNPDDNMIKHRDYQNRPKYNLAKGGYEPIDEKRFHYYKSGASKLFHDDKLLNTMTRMTMDGTLLALMPPQGISGEGQITSKIMIPGVSVSMPQGTTFTPLAGSNNLVAGFNAIQLLEKSMSESSQDDIRAGIDTPGAKTAYEIQKIEQNAKIQLGLFGKMVGGLVTDFGYLMIDNIIQHQTLADVAELTGGETRMKFAAFILPNQIENGKKVTKTIRFNKNLPQTPEDKLNKQFSLLDEEGGLDSSKRIYEVNPDAFRNLKFLITVTADEIQPKSDVLEKALALEAVQNISANQFIAPYFDPEALAHYAAEVLFKGDVDKYMKKEQPGQMQPTQPGQPPQPLLANQVTGANNTKSMAKLMA